MKGTVNGTVTAYVSNWFEWTGSTSTMKKYYYTGAQRIAMRSGSGTGTSGLQWIIGDHLGSTTKIANYDGTLISQRRYKPWGEARFGGTLSTTFAFTGQRQEVQLGGTDGLYYYGARWYDAALGRWLSPDSIIPEAAQGVQAWSRYTYVNNAPTRYQDPTGHDADCAIGEPDCKAGKYKRSQRTPEPGAPGYGESFGFDENLFYSMFPSGSQIQFSVAVAFPFVETNYHLYSINIVTSTHGDIQIFETTRDVTYYRNETGGIRYIPGPAENLVSSGSGPFATPNLGFSATYGKIYGTALEKEGTAGFEGSAIDIQAGADIFGGDIYVGLNKSNVPDPTYLWGADFGFSVGLPSLNVVGTRTRPLTPSIPINPFTGSPLY